MLTILTNQSVRSPLTFGFEPSECHLNTCGRRLVVGLHAEDQKEVQDKTRNSGSRSANRNTELLFYRGMALGTWRCSEPACLESSVPLIEPVSAIREIRRSNQQ